MTSRRGRNTGQSALQSVEEYSETFLPRYGVFHISGGMIDVEKIGERENNYENFMEDLLKKDGEKDDCRFASKLAIARTLILEFLYFLILQFTTTNTSSPLREPRPRLVPRSVKIFD